MSNNIHVDLHKALAEILVGSEQLFDDKGNLMLIPTKKGLEQATKALQASKKQLYTGKL